MMRTTKKTLIATLLLAATASTGAQTFTAYTSTDNNFWNKSRTTMKSKTHRTPEIIVSGEAGTGHEFRAWGTCFNELDWDALNLLTRQEQEEVMQRIFAPDGDLKFTRGRLSMNANDYSRSWYSCDDVAGDFQLRHFNIERDKQSIIPLINAARRYRPDMTFWVSPWSPPSWMKINQDYCVVSSEHNTQDPRKDYLLFETVGDIDRNEVQMAGQQKGKFPRRLAAQNYFIQDERYLSSYADMFCRFITLYAEQGVPIDMVMYQNEAYSYTSYPGCPWTAEGTIRFNRDYLAPALRKAHPNVKLYIGTFNTNRLDYVEKIIDGVQSCVDGAGFQWEGRENLEAVRSRYPQMHLVSSESECGNGSMDWAAGEHTFFLLADYIGKGCDEYFIWNFILTDKGRSNWGWHQNALVQVDSKTRQLRYTPEFYAVKHFSNLVEPGSRMVAYAKDDNRRPAIVFRTPRGKHIIIAGNFGDTPQPLTVALRGKYLDITLQPHSFNTFAEQ